MCRRRWSSSRCFSPTSGRTPAATSASRSSDTVSRQRSPKPVRDSLPDSSGTAPIVERSAGGVVIRILEGSPHVLLIRDPYRKWGLPKGHLEEGESTAEAALREVREETGLYDLELGPDLGEIDWVFRRRGKQVQKYCRFYLMASTESEAQPQISEGITECRWLPVSDAVRTMAYDNARAVLEKGLECLRPPRDGHPLW
ncbi:MAG: NUDIX hydrolase [Gemmatimonadetes bacterium]|nr:NUDIX hydrolase [Gemmatimonadota bacterium]